MTTITHSEDYDLHYIIVNTQTDLDLSVSTASRVDYRSELRTVLMSVWSTPPSTRIS